MKAGWTISAVGHAAVLAWGLVSFVGQAAAARRRRNSSPTDIISATDFSQITQRHQDRAEGRGAEAAGREGRRGEAGRRAERQGRRQARDRRRPPTSSSRRSPSPRRRSPSRSRPTPKPQPKPEPKQAFAKEPEPKPDPIAEALKKDTKKPDPKTQQKAETPMPPKKPEPPKPQPKFDASRIAALLDKRDPQRHAATGEHAEQHALARHADRQRRDACRRTRSTRCARGSRNAGTCRSALPKRAT